MSVLDGRHFVAPGPRLRRYVVRRTNVSHEGRHLKMTYTTVSLHFTYKGATKAARAANAARGHTS